MTTRDGHEQDPPGIYWVHFPEVVSLHHFDELGEYSDCFAVRLVAKSHSLCDSKCLKCILEIARPQLQVIENDRCEHMIGCIQKLRLALCEVSRHCGRVPRKHPVARLFITLNYGTESVSNQSLVGKIYRMNKHNSSAGNDKFHNTSGVIDRMTTLGKKGLFVN
jgi:hypothetical protein